MGNLKYISAEEVKKIEMGISSERDTIILRLLYETGCTIHELAYMKTTDFDLKKCILIINSVNTKNNKKRECRISNDLASLITYFIKKNQTIDYLFMTRQSGRITERRIEQLITHYSKESLGKAIHPRILRNSHIIHSFLNNKSITEIEKGVGIKNIQSYIYTFFRKENLTVYNKK